MHSFVEVWRPMKFKCFCGKGERRFRWTELRHADECVVSQGFLPCFRDADLRDCRVSCKLTLRCRSASGSPVGVP